MCIIVICSFGSLFPTLAAWLSPPQDLRFFQHFFNLQKSQGLSGFQQFLRIRNLIIYIKNTIYIGTLQYFVRIEPDIEPRNITVFDSKIIFLGISLIFLKIFDFLWIILGLFKIIIEKVDLDDKLTSRTAVNGVLSYPRNSIRRAPSTLWVVTLPYCHDP